MIGWVAIRYGFVDRWLAEVWVELSIIMTDDPSKNAMTTALSAKGVDTWAFQRSACSGITK